MMGTIFILFFRGVICNLVKLFNFLIDFIVSVYEQRDYLLTYLDNNRTRFATFVLQPDRIVKIPAQGPDRFTSVHSE